MSIKAKLTTKKVDWSKYNVRTCKSLHHCELCGTDITLGQLYHDGGYGKRVHVRCRLRLLDKLDK